LPESFETADADVDVNVLAPLKLHLDLMEPF
jgi:hypothetical protein